MDNIRYLATRERRRRKNGVGARCQTCSEARPFALKPLGRKVWRCYEHLFFDEGREPELHHISGLKRGPVLPVPANDHRMLTQKFERMLPPRLLSVTRSPVEEMIATIVGHVFVDDALRERPPTPYRSVDLPPGAQVLIARPVEFAHFAHVFMSDESYYRSTWGDAFTRLR